MLNIHVFSVANLSKNIFPNGQQITDVFSSLNSKHPSVGKCLVEFLHLRRCFFSFFFFLLYMFYVYNIIIQHLYILQSDHSKFQLPSIMLPLTPFTSFAYSPTQVLSANHRSLLCKMLPFLTDKETRRISHRFVHF